MRESGRTEPSNALVEVIHAALLSFAADRVSGQDPSELWRLIRAKVDDRLGVRETPSGAATPSSPSSSSPGTERPQARSKNPSSTVEPPREARQPAARRPADASEHDSLMDFIQAPRASDPGDGPAETPGLVRAEEESHEWARNIVEEAARDAADDERAPPPSSVAPAAVRPLESSRFRAPAHSETFFDPQEDDAERAAEREVAQLQSTIEGLRRRISELESELSARKGGKEARATSAKGKAQVSAYLEAFEVEDAAARRASEDAIARQWSLIAHYFEKTRGNLTYLFGKDGFDLSIEIPSLSEVIAADLKTGEGLDRHLEVLRAYWKGVFREIWIHLRPWCDDLAARLDPDRIEAEARSRKESPWDVYSDLARRLDLYDSLLGLLRLKIRNHLGHIAPQ